MKFIITSLLLFFPLLVFAYPSVPSPQSKGYENVILFDDVPGTPDFHLIYFNGTLFYNSLSFCGNQSPPCFGLEPGQNDGLMYRYNENNPSFDLEESGLYFNNQVPNDTTSFQSNNLIIADNVLMSFPFLGGFTYVLQPSVFFLIFDSLRSSGLVIVVFLVLIAAIFLIVRLIKRTLKGGEKL
jgi:hypothetical protein